MADLTFAQLFADLVEAAAEEPLPAEFFTRREFAQRANLDYQRAAKRLRELVAAGELLEREAVVDGKRQFVYWFPTD